MLNVTGYLIDWWAKNEAKCNSYPWAGRGFTACFQQTEGRGAWLDDTCNQVGISNCHPPVNMSIYTPEVYYGLHGMSNVHQCSSSIWFAADGGTILAKSKIGAIVEAINPRKSGDTSLGLVLSALSAGFAFVRVPASLGASVGTSVAGQAVTALQQAPGLGKAFLPNGSLDSQFKQLTSIQYSMGDVLGQFKINVANALNAAQSDFLLFSDLTRNGAYIGQLDSLNASTWKFTKTSNTFIVSQALQDNNIIITVAKDTNPFVVTQNLEKSPSPIAQRNAWHVNCHDNLTALNPGVCDNWWYDGKDSYSLFNLGERNQNYHNLMTLIFEKGWTTREDLFHGAGTCANASQIARTRLHPPSPIEDFTYDSHDLLNGPDWTGRIFVDPFALQASCSSNVRICQWNSTINPDLKEGRELFQRSVKLEFQFGTLKATQLGWNRLYTTQVGIQGSN